MWIDSHCHLNHEKIKPIGSPADIVRMAKEGGVEGMLTICCRIADEFPEVLSIAREHESVWCTVGTHPHDAGKDAEQAVTFEELVRIARSDPKIIGIGESGLDYFYDKSPRDLQEISFRKHIRACIETGLPLIVHARDADEDIIRILKEEGAGQGCLKGVMHCFSSGRKMAEEALDIGFYISFSGILTFKAADELRSIARDVPMDRLLVETDAPYLAPVPKRGETNQPAYVAHTGAVLAGVKNVPVDEMAVVTKANFFRLFERVNKN
jgi:TatD DNase family protein